MGRNTEMPTSPTLLGRLRMEPKDEAAWRDFVDRYGPKIRAWCREWKLQDADAHDVTQTVLLLLVRKIHKFVYDPARSFRGWLKTLTHHAWQELVQDKKRHQSDGREAPLACLESIQACESLMEHLSDAFDQEVFEEALVRVQVRVSETTWQAFHRQVFGVMAPAEVAEMVGLSVAAVYMAKSRVQSLLRKEIERLDRELPE